MIQDILFRVLIFVFSAVGLYATFPFVDEAIGHLWNKKKKNAPPVEVQCTDGTCIQLSKTRWARLLYIPNWSLGVAFYLLNILAILWTNVWIVAFAIVGSIFSIFFSLLLIYGLVRKLKAFCSMCYLAHAANFGITIAWLLMLSITAN